MPQLLFIEKTPLTLDGAGSHTLDNVLLAEQINNDDGDDAHHDNSHGGAQVHSAVAALQILHMDGPHIIPKTVHPRAGLYVRRLQRQKGVYVPAIKR